MSALHMMGVREAAAYLQLSVYTVRHYIADGKFPEPDLVGGQHSTAPMLWLQFTLDQWDDSRRKTRGRIPNSEKGL